MNRYKLLMAVLILAIAPLFYVKLPDGRPILSSSVIVSDVSTVVNDAMARVKGLAADSLAGIAKLAAVLTEQVPVTEEPPLNKQWLVRGDQPLPEGKISGQIFYRWTDSAGVEHLSSEPSTDYPYREIAVADNMNVLSFAEPAKEVVDQPPAKTGTRLTALTDKSSDDEQQDDSLADLLDNVDALKQQLESRNQLLNDL
jgi:hypothetical protein